MSYRNHFKGTLEQIRASYPAAWSRVDILDVRFSSLKNREYNITSQFGEDGLVEALFEVIGVKHRSCFEVGATDGIFFSNTLALREAGWNAVLIEADDEDFAAMQHVYQNERVVCVHAEIGRSPVQRTLDEVISPHTLKIDLGVIDIDNGNLEAWQDMTLVRPRAVLIECDERGAPGSNGVSADELTTLAKEKKYTLVARTHCNLLFVANEECQHLPNVEVLAEIKIAAVLSCPRLGFCDAFIYGHNALRDIKIMPYGGGAWWEKGLQNTMQKALDAGAEYIITMDYDSLFKQLDVDLLIETICKRPDIDVLTGLQVSRVNGWCLFTKDDEELKVGERKALHIDDHRVPFRVKTAHFGLTIIRASVLKAMPKPWLINVPGGANLITLPNGNRAIEFAGDGSWEQTAKGQIDADIYFWIQLAAIGKSVYVLPAVQIGHIEPTVALPNPKGGAMHCYIKDWQKGLGRDFVPLNTVRCKETKKEENGNASNT